MLCLSFPAVLWLLAFPACLAQHYCWPCAEKHGVVGKYTYAASEPEKCYDWHMKYLNNVLPGSDNTGPGWKRAKFNGSDEIVRDTDVPNIMSVEVNECGTALGNKVVNISPMTSFDWNLVKKGERLPTGKVHQCPCARQGRANIINGSVDESLASFDAVEAEWGKEYTDKLRSRVPAWQQFGLHGVHCSYHSSGPCSLADIERAVSTSWAGNFSQGYLPLMDNNILFLVQSLGPLLDAFLRDGVEFYPMRWTARAAGAAPVEMYSVLASPCGKVLIEVAANQSGGRPAQQFHAMPQARAIFEQWNEPKGDEKSQPLLPLRFSRAVPASKFEAVLAFYGVGQGAVKEHAAALGFQPRILADDQDTEKGLRAVTIMLSPTAKTHLQIWLRPEETLPEVALPSAKAFVEAAGLSLHPSVHSPAVHSQGFCKASWTLKQYIEYQLRVHESVMTPPPDDPDSNTPPAGYAQDIFIDDHFSWDCSAPHCNVAEGGKALYRSGSRIQWMDASARGFPGWGPYGYDPAGYGIQLHWSNTPEDFKPQGKVYPICFQAQPDGTCQGSTRPGM
ncbi:unnamed protein product [Polarella glacialis]|uniref:Uncharacterized protein n=1 Tax=Polarella glacialis TaxID=89957 RepID=A0A813LEA7_POLGL|nr:unnamed protein product [Polarella glacialis]